MIDWQEKIHEAALDGFLATGFMVLDGVFSETFVRALQDESGFLEYKAATLTHGEREIAIRGDNIRWIDEQCDAGMAYLNEMEAFGRFFNQAFYAGIRRAEAHYACYPVGFGYDWHKDNPRGRDERVISAVYYLNDDWAAADGGAIELVDKNGETQVLMPDANRLVVFDSNLLHKVAITQRVRYSIATWLRKDD
ncbi:MAG: 2OG-Fe(II) oxygenase [Moraxella sp.]|nr:2OG-Fe(II) oxygenase [Moraxella sp.]